MKQKMLLLAMLFFLLTVCGLSAAEFEDFGNIDRAWDGQESVTNKEFEEVMDALQTNQKKKEEKDRKKLIKKISGGGTSLHEGLNPDDEIKEFSIFDEDDNGQLLNIPVNLKIGDGTLEKGYYNVMAQKEGKKIYLLFYQSQYLKGKVPALETVNDFGEETVNFVKLLPCTDSTVKIIYGSLSINAYAYVPFKKE